MTDFHEFDPIQANYERLHHFTDVCDRKIPNTEFLKFSILLFKLYLVENQ